MSPDEIAALANIPAIAILVYLVFRAQAANERLIQAIVDAERRHAESLERILCSDKKIADTPRTFSETD